MANDSVTYQSIIEQIDEKNYSPVYFLHGEEPYFIDMIREKVENDILTPDQKEFNQFVYYGSDTNMREVLTVAKEFPMFSDYRVVVVKEAQDLKDISLLSNYLEEPQTKTILLLAYMKKVDARLGVVKKLPKVGTIFESKALYDNQVPSFISSQFQQIKRKIDPAATQLMAEFLGTDLHKIVNEIKKILVSVPADAVITQDMVKQYVGISKQYNVFEFKDALLTRNVLKANRIARFFADNPKQNPIQPILSLLFNTFSTLMLYYYVKDKSDTYSVSKELGVNPYVVRKDYEPASKVYNGWQTMRIIHEIRLADAASKGIDNASANEGDLLTELTYHILHDAK